MLSEHIPMRPVLWLALLLTGCGGTTLVVDSDTSWSGTVDGLGAISGHGRAEFDLGDNTRACWTVAKTVEAGTLHVYAKTSEWFGLGTNVGGEASTTTPLGSVSGCAT